MGANRNRIKGHCMMCACQDGRVRGQGWSERARVREKRLVGRGRRLVRGEVPSDQVAPEPFFAADREAVVMAPGFEHVSVDCAARRDVEGWRLHEGPADVCAACSDFDAGRLVPVSFCVLAMAACESEDVGGWY